MIVLFKPQGMTPLESIDSFRMKRPDLAQVTLSYAGRLDPMAEGLLLVLVGDENKKRTQFERLPKTYEFDVLLGIETDSFDLMGLIRSVSVPPERITEERIDELISGYTGTFDQEYPPFSSVRVGGRPLYAWAHEGRLPESIPSKRVTVERLIYIGRAGIAGGELLETVRKKVGRVQGNFRQAQIVAEWERALAPHMEQEFPVLTFSADVSGGTYIRSIAHGMGRKMGCGGLASRIVRTRIGKHTEPTA